MIGCYSYHGPDYMPTRGTPQSAGFDIRTPVDFSLAVGQNLCIDTGLVLKSIDEDADLVYYIHLRSSMGVKHGIMLMNGVGVVDKDYCGPDDTLKLFLWRANFGMELVSRYDMNGPGLPHPFACFKAGDRIAQIVTHRLFLQESAIEPLTLEALGANRGGFGSTGQK